SARKQNLADIFQQKRLATGHEDLFHAKLGRFTGDPLYPPEPQFSSGRGGRGTHATVVATQVTVEIRVQPKPRAHRAIVLGRQRYRPATENPPRTAFFERSLEQAIPGESAPGFQLRSEALFITDYGDQIARPAAVQHSDQLRQEPRRESLSSNIQIDVSLHRIGASYSVQKTLGTASSRTPFRPSEGSGARHD